MKFITSALCLVACVVLASAYSSSWGERTNTDSLLFRQNYIRAPVYDSYVNVNLDFPDIGETDLKTITGIFIYDNFANRTGAAGNLYAGGPGHRFAIIYLRSQYNGGINSTVEIYGK